MKKEDSQLLEELMVQIGQLKANYASEAAKRAAAEGTVAELNRKLEYADKKILELKVKCNNLTDAGLLSVTEDQRQESRKRLKQMVREIDKCLSLLR